MAESVTRQLFDMPPEIARLPRDHRGYPIPRFVAYVDGKPDFRVVDTKFWSDAVKQKLCWLCGGRMGTRGWFVTGPMCTMTRTSAEPPSHRMCALFAVKNCPFLTKPLAKRNERDLPPDMTEPGGVMIARNPGVTAILETRSYKIFRDPNGHPLIQMGDPDALLFFREGRIATRAEVMDSIQSGIPILMETARTEGPGAVAALSEMVHAYRKKVLDRFVPKGTEHGIDSSSQRA
jgi:hypothetical protein